MSVEKDVAKVISEFVSAGKAFISLDVYCKLGKHFDDSDNPIYNQVREAYSTDLMSNYLCKWTHLKLEGGGYSYVWKYYLPEDPVRYYDAAVRLDGRVEITKKALGQLSLLECNLVANIEAGKIAFHLADKNENNVVNAADRIVITKSMLSKANLDNHSILKITAYPNKVELTVPDSIK